MACIICVVDGSFVLFYLEKVNKDLASNKTLIFGLVSENGPE